MNRFIGLGAILLALLSSCSEDRDSPQGLTQNWTFEGRPQAVPAALSFGGSPYGSGTYRTTLAVPPGSTVWGLRLPIVGTAYELSVGGQVLAREGTVSTTAEGAVPSYRPRIVVLPPAPDGTLELELRVSNWHDQFTGLTFAPSLGPLDQILAARDQAVLWEAFVFGALVLMGLYHCGSFVFRSQNRAPLWFGVFCLLVALRSTLYGELLFLSVFPDTSWFVVIRGVYLTMSLGLVAFVAFVDRLYPDVVWRPAVWVAAAVGGGYGAINLLAPVEWTTALLIPFQLSLVVAGVYSLAVIGRALVRRESGAGLFVTGMAVFLVSMVADIGTTQQLWSFPSLVNLGFLVFVLMQALVVARLFAHAFASAETHSEAMATINTSLERFIPKEVLGFLGKRSITEIALGDYSERQMTVLFLDIRDFTSLSETMTPKETFKFINSFLNRFGPLVRNHGGFVDKYLGDGLMALFPGAPDEALASALAMRDALVDYNAGRARGGYVPVRFGIGIHSGPLMLGTIGENRRMDSTVISDTVNAASRLEGLTKKFGFDVLVSEETVAGLVGPDQFQATFVGQETVKGRTRPIQVYRIEAGSGACSPLPSSLP